MAWFPEIQTGGIPAGENGEIVSAGISGKNGENPVPVKGRSGKKKCIVAGRLLRNKGNWRNPCETARKSSTSEKMVGIPERQDGTVADERMDMGEKLTAGKARAICRKSQKKQIQYHDRAAVIPRGGREFGGCCKRSLRSRKFSCRSIRSFCRRKTVRKRRETVGGIQFRYSSCFHVDDYRPGLQ